jgi:hypothetical protein
MVRALGVDRCIRVGTIARMFGTGLRSKAVDGCLGLILHRPSVYLRDAEAWQPVPRCSAVVLRQ